MVRGRNNRLPRGTNSLKAQRGPSMDDGEICPFISGGVQMTPKAAHTITNPNEMQMEQSIVLQPCIESKCRMWDEDSGNCVLLVQGKVGIAAVGRMVDQFDALLAAKDLDVRAHVNAKILDEEEIAEVMGPAEDDDDEGDVPAHAGDLDG